MRLRLKCCCRWAALTCWHIWTPLPPPPPFFLITLVPSLMMWRALYPPHPRHPSLGPISVKETRLFDSMQVCQTKTDSLKDSNLTRFPSTSNCFGVSIQTDCGLKWALNKITACFQVSVYSQLMSRGFWWCDESLSELKLNQRPRCTTQTLPSALISTLKGQIIQWIPGVGPKGLIWNHFHIQINWAWVI